MAEVVLGSRKAIHDCWQLWQESKGWDNMFDHEWCVRKALGAEEDLGRVKVFRKVSAPISSVRNIALLGKRLGPRWRANAE